MFDEDNPQEFIKNPAEQILLIQLGAMGIFAAWAVGGNCAWAPGLIAAIGLFGPILLLIHNSMTVTGRAFSKTRYLRLTIPFLLWLLVLGLSYFQPLMSLHTFGNAEFFALENADPRLPGSALPVQWVGAIMLGGIYLGALNLLTVPETRLSLRMLLRTLSISAMALSILGFATMVLGVGKIAFFITPPSDDFFAVFPSATLWGTFALLWIGVLCGFIVEKSRTRAAKAFLVESAYPLCGILLLGVSIFLRGTPLQICLMGCLLGLAAILCSQGASTQKKQSSSWHIALLVGGVVLLVCGIIGGFSSAANTSDWLSNPAGSGGAPTWQTRLQLWGAAYELFLQRPWWGWGPNSFGAVLSFAQPPELGIRYYGYAFSQLFQSLFENGIVITALWILFPLGIFLKYAARIVRCRFCLVPLVGCIAVALTGVIDQPFANPAVTVSWFIIFFAAIQWARIETKPTQRARPAKKPLLKRNAPERRPS